MRDRQFFARRGMNADLSKLYGAMELAPMMGLADLIVDIVDTGNTLKANGLEPMDLVADISTRLVVNKAAMRSQHQAIESLVADIAEAVA